MPKYKVGDVAALFQKPISSTIADGGKKMQTLFEDYYSKSKKFKRQNTANQSILSNEAALDKKPVDLKSESVNAKPLKRKFEGKRQDISFKKSKKQKKNFEFNQDSGNFSSKIQPKKVENTSEEVYFPRNNFKNANFQAKFKVKSVEKCESDVNSQSLMDTKLDIAVIKQKDKQQRQEKIVQKAPFESGTVKNKVGLTNKRFLSDNIKTSKTQFGMKQMNNKINAFDKSFKKKNGCIVTPVIQYSKPKHIIFQDSNNEIKRSNAIRKENQVRMQQKSDSEDSSSEDAFQAQKTNKVLKQQDSSEQYEDSSSDEGSQAQETNKKVLKHQADNSDQSGDLSTADELTPKANSLKKANRINLKNVSETAKEDISESDEDISESEEDFSESEAPGTETKGKSKVQPKEMKRIKLDLSVSNHEGESESENDSPKAAKKKQRTPTKESKAESEERLSRTLFVGNLPLTITRKGLEKLFLRFGAIDSCRLRGAVPTKSSIPKKVAEIKKKYHSGVHSRIGYVVMKETKYAIEALSLSGSIVEDHHIIVDRASDAGEKKMYDKKCSVFVGNLPFDVEDEAMWSTFSQFGNIESIRVIRDKETGAGKGFGYVAFQKIQGKENALAASEVDIGGRIVRIKSVEIKQLRGRNRKFQKERKPDQWGAAKRIAWKEKKQQNNSGRKSLKKIMKKGKIEHQKKKVANIFKGLSSK